MAQDPYKLLGVAKTACDEEIKRAYRKLAKDLHPDRNQDNPRATEQFSEISAAYTLLSDPEQRARYDRGDIGPDGQTSPFAQGFRPGQGFGGGRDFRQRGGAGARTEDPFDIFADLFGGRATGSGRAEAPAGRNIAYRLDIPFELAVRGEAQRLTLKSGKTISLKLPPGFESGQQLRLAGQGEAGPGGVGDALVTLNIEPHDWFRREGDDVRLDLPIRLAEAVLGGAVKAPTATGAVMVTVPPGVSSGKVMRLKGRGFMRKDGSRGDQLVTLLVDIPPDDAALKAFVQGWPQGEAYDPRSRFGLSTA